VASEDRNLCIVVACVPGLVWFVALAVSSAAFACSRRATGTDGANSGRGSPGLAAFADPDL
jgi:hypothetical protein